MKIRLSESLVLGEDFVVSTAGCFGVKGTGKTHIAQVAAEEMLRQGHVIVVIDPVDAWWGLRASADGLHEGYPILVVGGDHGDLKLDLDGGAKLAEAVVEERFSVVICTDGLKDTEQIRFVRQFLETLFRLNRDPLHLFMDEADIFAPQTPDEQEQVFCRRALGHIVRRGRRKGIGSTLITQRPAELHATVRSMIETLFVLGLSHNLDIEAVEKWLRLRKRKDGDNAAFELREQMIDSLDSLPRGDAWVWAPRLKPPLHRRFRARDKETFDSGATPKPGHRTRVAKRLAPVDIARLGAAIADAVQRQKDNDPAELKKQVVALRRELDRVGKGQDRAETNEKMNHAENIELRTEVAQLKEQLGARQKPLVPAGDLARLEKILARAETTLAKQDAAVSRHHEAYQTSLENYTKTSKSIVSAAIVAIDDLRAKLAQPATPVATAPRSLLAKALPPPRKAPSPKAPSSPSPTPPSDLGRAELKILEACAWAHAIGLAEPANEVVAFLAGYTVNGHYTNIRDKLRTAGLVEYPNGGTLRLTEAGITAAPTVQRPTTNDELHRAVLERLDTAKRKLLVPLIEAWPNTLNNGELADRAGYTVNGHYTNIRGRLHTMNLIEYPRADEVRAADLLFPKA